MTQQNMQQKLINEWYEMDSEEYQMKEKMTTKKRKKMDEIINGMVERDEKIAKLEEKMTNMEAFIKENQALKDKVTSMKAFYIKELKSLHRRRMPAELLNELFASIPLENAFSLLAKMSNGLLARNVQKMINGIKEEMKNNKLNEEDCGKWLEISEGGFVLKHIGDEDDNCVRALLPIPSFNFLKTINKPIITFYYEMEILNSSFFSIGFGDEHFSLEGTPLGQMENSLAIWCRTGIFLDDELINFGNGIEPLEECDFVGLGIIRQPNSKIEYFVTSDGKLLGKAELPAKFAVLRLFPAVNLYIEDNLIGVNFGKKQWQFKEFGRVLE